jgi:putative molybdopterin biosynthesis protein
MASRDEAASLYTRLRELRAARGLSQQQLAARCSVTRQSIGAIEAGRYVPNTLVALALARELGCRVEDLFALAEEPAPLPVRLADAASPPAARVAVVSVRGRMVAHLLAAARELPAEFVAADGVLEETSGRARARLSTPSSEIARGALLLGCDPALGILRAHVERRSGAARLMCLTASSRSALEQLRAGNAHVAGTHLPDPATGLHNRAQATRALARTGGLLVRFASWEQGLAVAPRNPKRIRGVADLARPGIRFVNRDPGSGGRALLDELLQRERIPAARVHGYERVVTTHLAAAACVATGGADAAMTLRAAAGAYGLAFVPLAAADFDLVIPRDLLEHPPVAAMLDVLSSDALRRDLRGLAGYDSSRTGSVVLDLPARAS